MVSEPRPRPHRTPDAARPEQALTAAFGTDYGLHGAAWISRFSDMARQADSYRDRRVLLAGDAATSIPRWAARDSASACRTR